MIRTLATCEWIKTGLPLCLIGDSGTGTSHPLIALGTEVAMAGSTCHGRRPGARGGGTPPETVRTWLTTHARLAAAGSLSVRLAETLPLKEAPRA